MKELFLVLAFASLPASSNQLEWRYATFHPQMEEPTYLYTMANGVPRHYLCKEIQAPELTDAFN